jgi:hypothetical protein
MIMGKGFMVWRRIVDEEMGNESVIVLVLVIGGW